MTGVTGGFLTTTKVIKYKYPTVHWFLTLSTIWIDLDLFVVLTPLCLQSPSPPSQALFFFDFRDLGQVDVSSPSLDRGVAQKNTSGEQPPFDKTGSPPPQKKKTLLQDATLPCHNPSDIRFEKERWRRWLPLWIAKKQVWEKCWDVLGEYEAILLMVLVMGGHWV